MAELEVQAGLDDGLQPLASIAVTTRFLQADGFGDDSGAEGGAEPRLSPPSCFETEHRRDAERVGHGVFRKACVGDADEEGDVEAGAKLEGSLRVLNACAEAKAHGAGHKER